ncbi:MAG: DinB family protein [Acidobacteriota bacterium]
MNTTEETPRPFSSQLAADLEQTVQDAAPGLRALTDTAAGRRPQPDKWSAKEILGHLIDSACNNHRRFVRAQIEPDLVFSGYAQNEWVESQQYREADWGELVRLWLAYNLHLTRIIAVISEETLTRQRPKHNLHQMAWQPVPEDEPATLAYFIRDYVGHLQHHLEQIRSMAREG